jgi:hypothetical protein
LLRYGKPRRPASRARLETALNEFQKLEHAQTNVQGLTADKRPVDAREMGLDRLSTGPIPHGMAIGV